MDTIRLNKFSTAILLRFIERVPFFRDILKKDPQQLGYIMKYSTLMLVKPGETVIKRGESGFWVYFLIKGMLAVSPEFEEDKKRNIVGYIAPGEMFGEIAAIREVERNATIFADESCKRIILLATDFSPFGELDDCSVIGQKAKIIFCENVVNILRKRIGCFVIDFPQHPLAEKFNAYPGFSGEEGSYEHLRFVYAKAEDYAALLNEWGRSLETKGDFYVTKGKLEIKYFQELEQELNTFMNVNKGQPSEA